MPTTLLHRPTIAFHGFADPETANISTVEVRANDGYAVVRMPSRAKTLSMVQESSGSIYSNGLVRASNVNIQVHQDDNPTPHVIHLNATIARERQGRYVNFIVTPSGDEDSPLARLASNLYANALNNNPQYNGTLDVHLGIPETANMESLGVVEDHAIFQRIYESIEEYDFSSLRHATISDGFGISTTSADGARTFGLEIEVDFPDSNDYGFERRELARSLYDMGLSVVSEPQGWHYNARAINSDGSTGYSTAENTWSVEFDRSIDGVEGSRGCEIVSPILTDTARTWANVARILSAVRRLGGQVTTRTGLHVNIGTSDMRQDSVHSMLTTASQFDDLIVRLSHSQEVGQHHRGRNFCMPVFAPDLTDYYVGHSMLENNGHMSAINLAHMERPVHNRSSVSARAEFRYFDGTLQVGRIQAYVMLCMALVNVSVAGVENMNLPAERSGSHHERRGGNARRLGGEAWRESTIRLRQFIDHLRLTEEAAMAVTAAYRQSRWMRFR